MRVVALSDEDQLQSLLIENWPVAAIIAVILVVVWFAAPRLVRPLVRRALLVSTDEFRDGGVTAIELGKRSETLEQVTVTVVRGVVVATVAILVVGILGLWWLLGGLGILLAAVTLAGQPIVLDLLTGLTIVGEGTFFKGDNIAVGDPKFKLFGTVEVVGLRHTVIRAPDGTVHSIANRLMVHVSNRTRAFAGADVTVRGIREEQFARVLQIMNRVGQQVADDPDFESTVVEALQVAYVDDPDELGWTAVMRGKVVAGDRWAVGTEVRKRIVSALRDEGIELNRRGIAVGVLHATEPNDPVPGPRQQDDDRA